MSATRVRLNRIDLHLSHALAGSRSWTAREIDITRRMLADNLLASFTPGIVLVAALCVRQKLSLTQLLGSILRTAVLCSFYTYTFDVSNQAYCGDEDKINKPYRPIPSGLLTVQGAIRRFCAACLLYTIFAAAFGVLSWAILWQAATITINLLCPPRHYFWCKTLCMTAGVLSQLAQAWQSITPMDPTGYRWIFFMALAFPPPLSFEDVRDMAGDRAIGRRTLALMIGAWPIRVWFACILTVMPLLARRLLFLPEVVARWRVELCTGLLLGVCWLAAGRALILRERRADRITYQIFISSYIVTLGCGLILWS